MTGLPRNAVVADALREGQWWISTSRSRNPVIRLIQDCLPPPTVVNTQQDAQDDTYLWKIEDEVWQYFTSKAHVSPPQSFEDGVRWLKNPCRDKNTALILRLAFQASMYFIWRERNSRLHNASSRPASALILEIKSLLRCHLNHLTAAQRLIPPAPSLLMTWFGVFH
ncbi:PREDICTED: uncharacterized protein LOC109131697 [Camelina sativa]|uniref:Uncharacterized protein LOC109131697 n=1 Tax=Camelina sativa TaxID=90675 RepID=A0ABM1RHC7_CAMSA|nr:PREDICTED: uncharacterized protein LOC109131697 [Camelina sativa]